MEVWIADAPLSTSGPKYSRRDAIHSDCPQTTRTAQPAASRAVDEPTPYICGPWIAVLVLPGKISVFQHGGDWERSSLKVYIMPVAFQWRCDIWPEYEIKWLKCHLFQSTYWWYDCPRPSLSYDSSKESHTTLYERTLWLKPLVSSSVSAMFGLQQAQALQGHTAVTAHSMSEQSQLFVFARRSLCQYSMTEENHAVQRQTVVNAHVSSKQLLLFVFALESACQYSMVEDSHVVQ